jgi:hypothetical protein
VPSKPSKLEICSFALQIFTLITVVGGYWFTYSSQRWLIDAEAEVQSTYSSPKLVATVAQDLIPKALADSSGVKVEVVHVAQPTNSDGSFVRFGGHVLEGKRHFLVSVTNTGRRMAENVRVELIRRPFLPLTIRKMEDFSSFLRQFAFAPEPQGLGFEEHRIVAEIASLRQGETRNLYFTIDAGLRTTDGQLTPEPVVLENMFATDLVPVLVTCTNGPAASVEWQYK